MQAIADGQSVRAVASTANLHHSAMQVRLRQLGEQLGFEPTEPLGRTRLQLGLFLHALAHNRFD
ncbi:helix-turn-helix domain-containing protein [Nocardia salmonicida]|uniref:helix-turn-helix domain-containing protein n=1 Tax=Nocardia salmonicida TaxID=53431 RepID=UPI0033CB4CDE